MNSPFLLVLTSNLRVTPPWNSIRTLASAIGCPCESTTLPRAVPVCACAEGAASRKAATSAAAASAFFMVAPPTSSGDSVSRGVRRGNRRVSRRGERLLAVAGAAARRLPDAHPHEALSLGAEPAAHLAEEVAR